MKIEASSGESVSLKRWVRLLHIYLSLYALLIILFFGGTGFVMNHPDWFGLGQIRTEHREARTPVELCAGDDRLAIVEHLREAHGLSGLVQACEIETNRITVSFARAGRRADVAVDKTTGQTTIDLETKGLAAMLVAVHSGDDTGRFGRRVIDFAALFLIVSSLTGLALWASLAVRRETGIIWLLAGLALTAIVFLKLLN